MPSAGYPLYTFFNRENTPIAKLASRFHCSRLNAIRLNGRAKEEMKRKEKKAEEEADPNTHHIVNHLSWHATFCKWIRSYSNFVTIRS